MISLGNKTKFFNPLTKSLSQVTFEQARGYVERKGDEDIKWQWSVRDSPCQLCYQHKTKRSWISKIFTKKKPEDELTNRRKEVKYEPKIWELAYYNYLFPDCNCGKKLSGKCDKTKSLKKHQKSSTKSNYSVCGPKNVECEGKQILVELHKNGELKTCTEKLNFQLKEPFCLNEVCGKIKPPKTDGDDKKKEFLCLNHLIENQQKFRDGQDECKK